MVDSAAVRLNEPFRARAGLIKPMVHMLRDLAYLLFMVSHARLLNISADKITRVDMEVHPAMFR